MRQYSIAITFLLGNMGVLYAQNKDSLNKEKSIDEVIMVGTRVAPRSSISTPLPIDAIDATILQSSGYNTVDQALQYRIPSFNSTSAAVQDATSLLDPYEIRNLGSSRTLILVNGKRKNQSSLIFTQNTIGKGETGADLSSIPNIAIKKIEILRDGASAQYGSDAIAGVVNVILKDNISFSEVNFNAGLYSKGDGFSQNLNAITGTTFKKGGFITIATSLQNNNYAYRNGRVNAKWEAQTFGVPQATVDEYLTRFPDAQNKNAMPQKTSMSILANAMVPVSERSRFYGNASYVAKKVNSFANYRPSYWVGPENNPLAPVPNSMDGYIGFGPTFEGNISDYGGTLGFKTKTLSDWAIDISATTGGNEILYTVRNTFNPELGLNSPTSFSPGGFRFNNLVGNIDVNRRFSDLFAIAFGTEARREWYEIYAGDLASYMPVPGAISFPGMNASSAGKFSRSNIGVYADAAFDFSEKTALNATVRYENYSDFGSAFVWKGSLRQDIIGKKLIFRASASTGFRAPSLQQIYLSTNQASFTNGSVFVEGLFSNVSPEATQVGIPKLTAERSLNFTSGFGIQPNKNFSVTIDGYWITIRDRILLSSRMRDLGIANVASASFFINGINTQTIGADMVANYRNIALGKGKMAVNLAANVNYSKILRQSRMLETLNQEREGKDPFFNRMEEALTTTSRPAFKGVAGIDYTIQKWNFSVNNTIFGTAKFVNDGTSPDAYAGWNAPNEAVMAYLQFRTRMTTDLMINFHINDKNTINVGVLNVFNVIPRWRLVNVSPEDYDQAYNAVTFNGRYPQAAYDSQHFNIFGTRFTLGYNIKF
ncbi:ferric enterobactin receptor [Chryseobacterium piperi]|uniref:TonB-dependent receptor plug domain-containing protein n=1 Tax=Chryseobacterium piperi TaxID=558152 RepID=UPI00068E408C|nr:TonB-dependent receptor [Chryseobacterium piperi]ASW74612.1 ferric enterobactin receptor [Chryseobacterium piperi]